MDAFKDYASTGRGKVSIALWVILGIIFFVFFIYACKESLHSKGYIVRKVEASENNMGAFPSFMICPQFESGGDITDIQCTIQEKRTKAQPINPVLTYQRFKPDPSNEDYVCYGFNLQQNEDIGNHTVRCQINATNTQIPNSRTAVLVYFYATGGDPLFAVDYTECASCVEPQNSWILPTGYWSHVGIEKMLVNEVPTFKVNGESFTENGGTQSADIQAFFYWNTRVIWHYESFNWYNFWHWMGLVGGAAFLIKIIHDFIIGVLNLLIFKEQDGHQPGKDYQPIH